MEAGCFQGRGGMPPGRRRRRFSGTVFLRGRDARTYRRDAGEKNFMRLKARYTKEEHDALSDELKAQVDFREVNGFYMPDIEAVIDGKRMGFWCCPTPGCDGKGFGFDIFPTNPDYRTEDGQRMWYGDEDGEDECDDMGD